jgi:hypothetical protein
VKTNSTAIAALVASLLSWVVLPLVASVPAVILAHTARRQIKRTGEAGDGIAMAALIGGYANIIVTIVVSCVLGVVVLGCFTWFSNIPGPTDLPTETPSFSPSPLPTG